MLGCLQLIALWSCPLQWMDFNVMVHGIGIHKVRNSLHGALCCARRCLKALGWDIGDLSWRKKLIISNCTHQICSVQAGSAGGNPSGVEHTPNPSSIPVPSSVKDQVLQRHLVKPPWYARWCLKLSVNALYEVGCV